MGCIIRMNSEKFMMNFLKEYDPSEFQFILISENITNNKKYKNVMPIQALLPPPNIAATFANGDEKEYKKRYLDYLKKDDINSLITIIVKAALSDMKLILLCSKSEDEFGYLKLICDFIEKEYRLKTLTLKEYRENPQKATKIKNKEEVTGILVKSLQKLQEVGDKLNPQIDEDKFVKKLKKMGKKELYAYCKAKHIKVDKEDKKKKMIKKITKKIFKD